MNKIESSFTNHAQERRMSRRKLLGIAGTSTLAGMMLGNQVGFLHQGGDVQENSLTGNGNGMGTRRMVDEQIQAQFADFVMNGKTQGLIGDGVADDSVAFSQLIQNHIGKVIYLPNGGVYNLSSWTTIDINEPLTIIGMPGGQPPIIRGLENVSLFRMHSSIHFQNVAFESWSNVFDCDQLIGEVPYINLYQCTFNQIRTIIRCLPTDYSVPLFHQITVKGCHINHSRSGAFIIRGRVGQATFKDNTFKNIVYRGISIGHNAPSAEQVTRYQNNWKDITISNNHFQNIYRDNAGELQAIIVYGWRVNIVGNYIEDMSSPDLQAKDMEGIYIKCRYANIENNILIDASGEQGGINVKGQARRKNNPSSSPESYGIVVRGNKIISRKPMSSGIHFQTADILIEGNYIEGVTYRGVWANHSESGNVKIINNIITHMDGRQGIYVRCVGENIEIMDNIIEELKAVASSTLRSVGIHIDLPSSYPNTHYKNYKITGNTIRNAWHHGSDDWAILIRSSGGSFKNTMIQNNIIQHVYNGIHVGPSAIDVKINDNIFEDITEEKIIFYSQIPSLTIKDNSGYVTRSSGLATVNNDENRVTVEHGLSLRPANWGIQVTPMFDLGNLKYWIPIEHITNTTFDIVLNAASHGSLSFAWQASGEYPNHNFTM